MSAAKPEQVRKSAEILKAALKRPVAEQISRLKSSGIVDANGQPVASHESDATGSNGKNHANGRK